MERKEAIEIARKLYSESLFLKKDREAMVTLILELKESEDEKIRKALLIHFKNELKRHGNVGLDYDIITTDAITWLEKQGRQEQLYIRFGEIPNGEKSKIYQGEIEVDTENGVSVYPAFETNNGDIILGLNLPITKTTLHTQQHLLEYDDRPCYLVKGNYVGKDTDGQPLIDNVSIIKKIGGYRVKEERIDNKNYVKSAEKQGEQKFADKVEPKFQIGKWIVWKNKCYKVNDNGCGYELIDQMGLRTSLEYGTVDESAHVFAVKEDAKDGDVLVASDGSIFLLKGVIDCACKHYVALTTDGAVKFNEGLGHYWETSTAVHPATKEQRDILFQKMKEAGYEWDAEKKELKEIVVPIFNIGNTIIKKHNSNINDFGSFTITNITGGKYWYKDRIICDITKQDEWELYEPVRQKSAAWSKEDERMLDEIIDFFENGTVKLQHDLSLYASWLKFIKNRVQPQNTWKPSDRELGAILAAIGDEKQKGSDITKELQNIYQQLKKLSKE